MKLKPQFYFLKFLITSCSNYIKNFIKSCVKVCIGREPSFTPTDLFFRSYFFSLIGRRVKITCSGVGRDEGPGSQALMVMKSIAFARACGLDYAHTPFSEIAHADRPMKEWAGAWERLFNFGLGEVRVENGGLVLLISQVTSDFVARVMSI